MINDQWCDAKITKVIAPTEQEILQSQEEDDEVGLGVGHCGPVPLRGGGGNMTPCFLKKLQFPSF